MKNTSSRTTRAPVMNAIQTGLRNLLAMELEHLQLQPDPDTQRIQDSINTLSCCRSDPETYDAMFNQYLDSLHDEEQDRLNPAALGRLYSQWDREQQAQLTQLKHSLTESTAKAAEKRLRSAIDECIDTVLTTSSVYGQTVTEQLELMNPAAADPARPVIIFGPDGLKAPVKHWYQVLLLPLQSLAERNAISRALCPVKLQGARHPVLEVTPEDNGLHVDAISKRARALPGGFTLWIHHSTPQICRITADTIRALGHHPEEYTVQYHPKDLNANGHQATLTTAPALEEVDEAFPTEAPTS